LATKMRSATIVENSEIARASRWLVIRPDDPEPLTYEPGNVLSLQIAPPGGRKQHHAYTVTQCDPQAHTFTLLYRVIPGGRMTPVLESLKPGSPVAFDGKYHNPIQQEISSAPRAVLGISTGTGIGPLYGFAQKVLSEGSLTVPLALYAGFREEADICLGRELDALEKKYPNFSWKASLSKPGPDWQGLKGRVTQTVPPALGPLDGLHFHVVGNGSMLMDFYEALRRAPIADERFSSETYFNWDASFDEATVESMLAAFSKSLNNVIPGH
jgi:NAD(P)H-flavin reductase